MIVIQGEPVVLFCFVLFVVVVVVVVVWFICLFFGTTNLLVLTFDLDIAIFLLCFLYSCVVYYFFLLLITHTLCHKTHIH